MHTTWLNFVGCVVFAIGVGCGGGSLTAPTPTTDPPTSTPLPQPGPAVQPLAIVPGQPINVLFIGNSLTQANGLPLMVMALAAGAGVSVKVTDVSQGGFSLEDHWNDTRALKAIDQGGWHF